MQSINLTNLIMKKLFTLLLAVPLLMSMYSCSSDNDDDKEVSIIGKWELIKGYGEVEATPEALKNEILDELKEDYDPRDITILEFEKDGKGIISDIAVEQNHTEVEKTPFTYTSKGDKVTITFKEVFDDKEGRAMETRNGVFNKSQLILTKDRSNEFKNDESRHENGKVTKAIQHLIFKRK